MAARKQKRDVHSDEELEAMRRVTEAVKSLPDTVAVRVLTWVRDRIIGVAPKW
jgi:hypothetical protein